MPAPPVACCCWKMPKGCRPAVCLRCRCPRTRDATPRAARALCGGRVPARCPPGMVLPMQVLRPLQKARRDRPVRPGRADRPCRPGRASRLIRPVGMLRPVRPPVGHLPSAIPAGRKGAVERAEKKRKSIFSRSANPHRARLPARFVGVLCGELLLEHLALRLFILAVAVARSCGLPEPLAGTALRGRTAPLRIATAIVWDKPCRYACCLQA